MGGGRRGLQEGASTAQVLSPTNGVLATFSVESTAGQARRRMPRKATQSKVCATKPQDQMVKPSSSSDETITKPLTSEKDLLHAIGSLYDDHLRPYGRLIRKRLGEDAEAKGIDVVDGNLGRLRAACEGSRKIKIEAEADGEWSAVLVGRSIDFVDFYSHDDPYPAEMWKAAEDYFQVLETENGSLPGGRYATALALMKLELPFLSVYSLGQVCHIVELAMTTRKLLGYLEGAIVPYACSHSKVKDSAAEQRVGNGNAAQQLPLASWDIARTCLREILVSATRKGKASVPLSTLKRLYRSRFHTELSETALGYTKLTELLQDPRIADLCTVRLLEQGYVLTPGNLHARCVYESFACHTEMLHHQLHQQHQQHQQQQQQQEQQEQEEEEEQQRGLHLCIEEPLRIDDALQPSHELWVPSKWESLSASNFAKDGCIGSMVQNTFIHATEPRSALSRDTHRSKSVPKNMGSRRCAWESSCHALAFMPRAMKDVTLEQERGMLSCSMPTQPPSDDWTCSIDVDIALQESDNVGMMSGSFCDDSITFGDLASCLTFCVEEGHSLDNLDCSKEVCSPHFPLILPSPAATASPWGTPTPHSLWVPAAADSFAPTMCAPLSEVVACSGMMTSQSNNFALNFASCQALCPVSMDGDADQVHPGTLSSRICPPSPVLTASPQWTPRPVDLEVPWEEPKTVLRLVDLL